jgi:hypothetical protein
MLHPPDRQITNEPWSSMQGKKEGERERERKTLLGEKKEVCSKRV